MGPTLSTRADERRFTLFDSEILIRAASARTGGAYCLLERELAPGAALPPLSIRQNKRVLVLEGCLEIDLEAEVCRLGPGDIVHLPGPTLHAVRNPGRSTGRHLEVVSPGGHDAFLERLAQLLAIAGPSSEAVEAHLALHGALVLLR